MIVKSAALSSNQAVGVRKSLLDICKMKMTRSDWRTLGWQDRLLRWVPGWAGQNGRRTPLVNSMLLSNILNPVLMIEALTSKMYPRVGPSTATLNLIPC